MPRAKTNNSASPLPAGPDGLPPTHPGAILKDEIDALGLSLSAFAAALHVGKARIAEIFAEKRAISADTALRLSRYLGTSPDFWLRLQAHYDLKIAQATGGAAIEKITPRAA
jgi:addiction module HigA family antidote